MGEVAALQGAREMRRLVDHIHQIGLAQVRQRNYMYPATSEHEGVVAEAAQIDHYYRAVLERAIVPGVAGFEASQCVGEFRE